MSKISSTLFQTFYRYALFTIAFPYNPELKFVPGSHINIFLENDPALVNEVLSFLIDVPCLEEIVEWTGNYLGFGIVFNLPMYFIFAGCDVPISTLRHALAFMSDLVAVPSKEFLGIIYQYSTDEVETDAIEKLCLCDEAYAEWAEMKPDVADFFKMFPGLKIPAASFEIQILQHCLK